MHPPPPTNGPHRHHVDRHTIDSYASLSHRAPLGDPYTPSQWRPPTWVPASEQRRIAAYTVRDSIDRNVARWFLPATYKASRPEEYREYGDPGNALDRYTSGVLGEGWQLEVDGANVDLPDTPELPPEPALPDDAGDLERRVHATRLARWATDTTTAVDEWETTWAAQPALRARQDQIREWADRVHLRVRLRLFERRAAGLGDSIMVLWPRAGDWPTVETSHPAGYFPVLEEHDDSDYPAKVHLAWEYETTDGATVSQWLRRISFELVAINDLRVTTNRRGERVWADASGNPPADGTGTPMLTTGEGVDPVLGVWRHYPWAYDGATDQGAGVFDPGTDQVARRSYTTCIVSDGSWPMNHVGDRADALDESKATWRTLDDGTVVHHLDYGVDFLPVIHRPGFLDDEEHFGASLFDGASQALDDLATADTGVAQAAAFLPRPTVYQRGITATPLVPGAAYGGPADGGMDVVDFTDNHQAAVAHSDRLQDRALQVMGLPRELVGKVDSSDAVSGITMALAFGPYGQAIVESRDIGAPKHRLIARMAQRMAQVQGVLPPGPTPTVHVAYGPYLPANQREAMDIAARGLEAQAMSTQTAVAVLVAAGFPVDDARAEVDRIRAEDTEGADRMADALAGAPNLLELVADRLGVELPETPAVTLPPFGAA